MAAAAQSPHQDRGLGAPIFAGRLVFGVSAFVIYLLVTLWYELGEPFGPGVSCALAYGFFVLHILISRKRLSALDPVAWIIVSMLMFYFGVPVAIALLPSEVHSGYDSWHIGVSPNLYRGYAALLLTEVSFIWGVYLAGIKDLSRGPAHDDEPDHSLADPALLMILGGLVMFAGGVALVGPSVVFGTYNVWWGAKLSGADPRFIDQGTLFAMAGVFGILATDHRRRRGRRYFALIVALLLGVVFLMKGDRSSLIALGIGCGWCWSQRISRIRPALALAAAVAAISVLPLIKEFREYRSIAAHKSSGPVQLLGEAFYEMGSSANAMIYTLDLIPARGPYRWGMSYVDALLQAVPNFGLTPGKSFVLNNMEYHPSTWITFTLNPNLFESGAGYGYAMAAEWYFNYGIPAVFLGMTFFGWITGRIRNSSQRSALRLVASALFLAAMAIYVRNIIGYPLKLATWPVIGLWVISRVFKLLRGSPRPQLGGAGLDSVQGSTQPPSWQRDGS